MDAKPKIYDDAEMQHLLMEEKANQNEDSSSQNADSEISVLPSERIVKQRHNSGKGQAPGKADSSRQGPSHRLKPNHDDSWYAQREQQRIESYLRTIKDLPTIDWVYDATKEIDRKTNLHMELESSYLGFLWKAYDASQGWIVVFVAGILTALFSGFIDIGTEWISYMRFGYCQHGFWLSRTVCCLEHSLDSECTAWVDWGDLFYSSTQTGDYINYFFFVLVSIIPAGLCAWIIQVFCPSAAGSGIPEVKVILGGFVVKGYLSAWTLFIKCIGLVMSVGSGLNVGKEGPMIHVASCCGNILCGMFPKYANNQAKRREVIAATAAAGVSAAFSAPIGGVLFSLEEASSFFPHKTMLRSFLSASTAAVVIRYINPLHSFKMVLYEVHYHTPWYWFEMPFFIFLGVCGGLLGALYIKLNVYICQKRKSTFVSNYPVSEVVANIIVTSLICYYSPLLRINSAELIGKLFSECSETFGDDELSFICNRGSLWKALGGLTFAFIVKFTLTVITIGTKIPAGLLIPSLAIGSCFGRIIGILVETMYYENPKSFYFSECIQSGCITPGVYAMVGAAATLGGVSRTTVSIAVIMFELTGGLAFMVPIMLAVLTSKWVGDSITEGIYDENITNAGYPYIDPKKEVMIPTPCSFLLQGKDLYACQMEGDTLTTLGMSSLHN
eukprot:TRINITY_DN5853_c0_g1_i3.p1 TRINITY_DN5853_c0_g1~~TRINITY_DN5853_c0_g1_i3.p1  ORF type:complete len:670 (+),score=99.31 TRINITY_DN5853_c0_g1_i3:53-2062(+)